MKAEGVEGKARGKEGESEREGRGRDWERGIGGGKAREGKKGEGSV